MDDVIYRQAVQEMVDRIGGMYPYRQIGNRESYSQYNEAWTDAIDRVDAELNSLPSAQPETIRCKDCKWCEDADGLMCKNTASWVVATDCDFGCVLAERREE